MNAALLEQAQDIARRFLPAGDLRLAPLGRGLINDSFRVAGSAGDWVLQRINQQVFADAEGIMANLSLIAAHLSAPSATEFIWPALAHTPQGRSWLRDPAGGVWRMIAWVPGQPLDRLRDERQAAEVGRLLGAFHLALAELDPRRLRVTLPGFHVTPRYLAAFDASLAEHPPAAGGPGDRDLDQALAFVASRRGGVAVLEDARAAGLIPERVVHGDPKLDNLLFDPRGRQALALIDLDTIQPGLILHDLGDCLRSCCNRRGEGAKAARVSFDLEVCRPLLAAYAHRTRGWLQPGEIALLYEAIRLLPFELGLRFLTDHLQGDRWFRVAAHGENLDKAGVQFALVRDIEAQEAAIRELIRASFSG